MQLLVVKLLKIKITKNQEACGILNNLLGTQIPILGHLPLTNILF